jgi:ABC-type multidrug transport system fused ATPase/permease subunit
LARAVYSDADIFLLDDPLSAVDAYIGQLLFDECIFGLLRAAGKTVVLSTHHLHLLPRCDKIVVLQEGVILFTGTFSQLQHQGIDVNKLLQQQSVQQSGENRGSSYYEDRSKPLQQQHRQQSTGSTSTSTTAAVADESVGPTQPVPRVISPPSASMSSDMPHGRDSIGLLLQQSAIVEEIKEDVRQSKLMTVEERKEGSVSYDTYMAYIRAGGIPVFCGLIAFAFLVQLFSMSGSFWLAHWGAESEACRPDGNLSTDRNLFYLNIYACFGGASIISYSLRALCNANHRVAAARNLHRNVLQSVMNCPVSFFDTTPIGRILSRFSQDLATIDEELAMTIIQVSNGVSQCVFAVIAVLCATKGVFLAFLVPLAKMYRGIEQRYRTCNTAVARLESVSRSPIYADFNQMLAGMASVKAYRLQNQFFQRMQGRVDSNTIAMITGIQLSNWLAIRLDLISAAVSFFVAVLALLTEKSGFISPGFLGLGLVYSLQLTTYLKYFIRTNGALEAQMNAVERLQYYSTELPQEELPVSSTTPYPSSNVPDTWPTHGTVEVKNASLKYRDGPLILKNVSFTINDKEKVGIAGRTGSGKSSLLVALFRIEELSSGSIFIDGLDIRKVPLHVLRSRLGIIPQESVMFSETIRFNLDPFDEHSDPEVWEALERVNMKEYVRQLPFKLQDRVAEGGGNFSAGQRQVLPILFRFEQVHVII